MQLTIGGPYNSGILARDLDKPVSFDYQLAPPPLVDKARALKAVCDRHGVELKAAALQFLFAALQFVRFPALHVFCCCTAVFFFRSASGRKPNFQKKTFPNP